MFKPWTTIFLIASLFFLSACERTVEEEEEPKQTWVQSVADAPFLQEESDTWLFQITPPGLNPDDTRRPFFAVALAGEEVYFGGPEGVYKKSGRTADRIFDEGAVYSLFYDSDAGTLYAGGEDALYEIGQTPRTVSLPGAGRIHSIAMVSDEFLLAAEGGLYVGPADGLAPHAGLSAIEVFDVAVEADGAIWAATKQGIWRIRDEDLSRWSTDSYLLSDRASSVVVDAEGAVWIGTSGGLTCRTPDGEWVSYTGAWGLPYEVITSLAADPKTGDLWIGTTWGAVRKSGETWNYYAGRRWLSDDDVYNAAMDPTSRAVWFATDNGVTRIRETDWTLHAKAMRYEEGIRKRHDRLMGLVAECDLMRPGSLAHPVRKDSDNDGLWTAMYLASLCFRYAVTGEDHVKDRIIRHFNALAFLEEVTMRSGLIARSVVPYGEKSLDPACTPYCQWQGNQELGYDWKSDASSDEMTGHFYAYAIYYDLAAEGAERDQLIRLVHRIATHLVENDYFLIDWDGEPTTWGIWNPEALYNWWNYRYLDPEPERLIGLVYANSLEILSFMRTAHHITGDETFLDAYHDLAVGWGLADMVVNAAVSFLTITNHSTDELLFLAYYPLLRYEDDPVLRAKYLDSLRRSFSLNRIENSSFFNITFGALVEATEDFGLPEAVANLRNIPLDLVTWMMNNTQRADITIDGMHEFLTGEKVSDMDLPPLPADERPIMKWNGDPFRLDGGDGGRSEEDGTFYLLPYWMGRYHGFISQDY